ncbi:MAG TPA: hypothetical protein ENI27_01245 [bacterium]|nr:hypothetical protein [bacterium]
METRIFHGDITPNDIARALLAKFNRGNLRAQTFGKGKKVVIQIATRERPASGGQTAMSVTLQEVEDGVAVQLGKQSWLGVAASLGMTALTAWRNPWSLLGRLDDLAQDIENLQISEQVWNVIENAAQAAGASFQLSERLRRIVCSHCNTANPVGEPSCIACGAPLGDDQLQTCMNCGFVVKTNESHCPNCGQRL